MPIATDTSAGPMAPMMGIVPSEATQALIEVKATAPIYVTEGCFGCDVARDLAKQIAALDVPGLQVTLTDLGHPEAECPPEIFAVPTYLLDGAVVSLGNPEESSLLTQLGVPTTSVGT
ncbi:MAG TPA: hypothetical protein VGR16_11765 [Thermomicrobiales bacterium]|nr:hypothetical protein [Thermomicrobiales bacterium]